MLNSNMRGRWRGRSVNLAAWRDNEYNVAVLQAPSDTAPPSASEAEPLDERLRRVLRTRVLELEAAERHIGHLEEKLLGLKEAKRELKQLQNERRAFRKSSEWRVGRAFLAPYRLLGRFWRNQHPDEPSAEVTPAAREYQAWFARHRATNGQLDAMRREVHEFSQRPLISIITPVFNTRADWLHRAVESVRAVAEGAGSPVELDLPPTEVLAEIDPRRIERIVRNLMANALDHGEGEPVRVSLAADSRAVTVLVRDHGVGLRPGEAELVFTRFWRADPSRNRRTGGTGLGLSISLEDARLHGGWLQAWGEPGRGAVFRLTLPRALGAELEGSPLPLVPADEPPLTPATAVEGAQ